MLPSDKILEPIIKKAATPFIEKWKAEVIQLGLALQVPYQHTHTCYEGIRPACGRCDACVERLDAFRRNNAVDPLEYEK